MTVVLIQQIHIQFTNLGVDMQYYLFVAQSQVAAYTNVFCVSLQLDSNCIYTSSADGALQCFEYVPDGRTLRVLFRSEKLRHRFGGDLTTRSIHDMCVANSVLYYGDDGPNIKALQWKDG